MALKSLFGNLFKKPDEGPSVQEIDAELAAAVRSIEGNATVDVEAEKVLQTGWGKPGDMVYIMSLSPIYKILGSRIGRTATNLRENCKESFNKYVRRGMGQASFVGDNFFMRFYTLDDSEGFHRAAVITNEIGTSILGDRFQTVDVPDLVIAAETQHVTNVDGSLNLEKTEAAIVSGGAKVDRTPKDRLKSVQVAFYPTWSPSREVVETFACYARRKSSHGLLYGNAVYPESASDPLSILIDGKMAKLAVRDMATLSHFNWDVNLFLPLRFSTLRSRHAEGIARILGEITPPWRQKHLIFEILDIPDNATAEHMKPIIEWTKTHGHGAAARISITSPQLDRIAAAGAEYACFDFEESKDQAPDFKEYVSQVHAAGLQAALWNVSEHSALNPVIAAGFDLMNGTAVIEPTGAVDNRRELTQNHLMIGII